MHSKIFEIECKEGFTEGIEYDLPEWWTSYNADYFSEESVEESKESIRWLEKLIEVKGNRVDFSKDKSKRIKRAYEQAKSLAVKLSSMSFEDFKGCESLALVEQIASAVEDKYDYWFYNPTEGEEMITLDEMLHRGGKYYLTGRTWDYHY